ncbi:MAG: DUF2922 domain-containing protein [Dehalobacter sp. 4CP]|jgi:hypothetical protein|uniref:DUF2922 family protein n=2 Tax=Dehalobacter restrictus TaxID=55583 RepID=A0A857DFE2_9FIRM|nr:MULTISPECIES: DUF2922 domain-containing protein [Dehalobacter]NBJ16618.1 DUF2922 domain-containing protein [Dehalobacter sp. 4CP]AHF08861.1 hypothetical protein DEHRE_00850 [Dehalobacter restrictus DSM 9455]MCG1024118.1 DUF2922 domain-containing protein [Dehalobacter sp.]MCM1566190.1 DUF2922 domain-containing protein [Dehalobacter sp.]MDJ0305440.1 DUF2922 domain-containing protein [Dehalobacter sp.]
MANTRYVRLTFATTGGKTFGINVPDPIEGLTKAQCEAVMDTVIERNIFLTSSGELQLMRDVKVYDNNVEDLYDPPEG